jgi:hypothetical protein
MIYCPVTRHARRSAPSPLAGEGWGGGCLARRMLLRVKTPLPPQLRCADLPHKAGLSHLGFDARSERALPLPACGERGGVRGTRDLQRVGQRDQNLFQYCSTRRVLDSRRLPLTRPRCARSTSPRKRGEVSRGKDLPYAKALPRKGGGNQKSGSALSRVHSAVAGAKRRR